MRPLRYLVVTWRVCQHFDQDDNTLYMYEREETYRLVLLVEVVHVSVQDLDEQLD